jgi:hypothetical protein
MIIFISGIFKIFKRRVIYIFKDKHPTAANDSHPNKDFSGYTVKLLFNRIIDVIDFNGSKTTLTGELRSKLYLLNDYV